MFVITVPKKVMEKVPAWAWTWADIAPGREWGLEGQGSYEEMVRAEETLLRLVRSLSGERTARRVARRLGVKVE